MLFSTLLCTQPEVTPQSQPLSYRPLSYRPLSYRLRADFWNAIFHIAFQGRSNRFNPLDGNPNQHDGGMVEWKHFCAQTPFSGAFTTKKLPKAERSIISSFEISFINHLMKWIPMSYPNLPSIPADPEALMKFFPNSLPIWAKPVLPNEIKDSARHHDVLGALMLFGPFSTYIQRTGFYNFELDLSRFESIPTKPGLKKLGGKAYFCYNPYSQEMETNLIQTQDEVCTNHFVSRDWDLMQKRILGALHTDLIAIKHLTNTHLCLAGTVASVTYHFLTEDHPIKRMLHPHINDTLFINNKHTKLLTSHKSSFLPLVFSYELPEIIQLINNGIKNFDIRTMDFEEDLKMRGFNINHLGIAYPYADNAGSLWRIIKIYATDYVNAIYPDDTKLAQDVQLNQWFEALNRYIPNGIKRNYTPVLNKEALSKLLNTIIFSVSVEHNNVGGKSFQYSIWQQYIPLQVYEDGSLMKIDAFNALINLALSVSEPSARIIEDFSPLAPQNNPNAIKAMQDFHQNLLNYQKLLVDHSHLENPGVLLPSQIESAVRA